MKQIHNVALLISILFVGLTLRAYQLGRTSLWFDEVVTMRLARAGGPAELVELLGRIDASEAPLHPLVLQGWVKVFGASDASGRSFSVACGVLTVLLAYRIGRRASDDPRGGLWGAWLVAVSPPLLQYSREVRMYALLVLVTSASWDALLALRGSATAGRLAWYAACLSALGYAHPLGLFMAAALGLAALVNRVALGLSWGELVAPHAAAALAIAPWLGRYLSHEPKWTIGRQPLKILLGMPIGFIGGNFLTLAGFAALIVFGTFRIERSAGGRRRVVFGRPVDDSSLLIWFILAPGVLYAYSWLASPIFGLARYTLFVAPAYLILVGRGVAKLPGPAAFSVGLGSLALSVASWPGLVYAPDAKSDWRAAASALDRIDPTGRESVVVVATVMLDGRAYNIEQSTARYYLEGRRPIVAMPARLDEVASRVGRHEGRVWFSVGVRGGRPIEALPEGLPVKGEPIALDGLRLTPVDAGRLP